jgi:hypothetical protein
MWRIELATNTSTADSKIGAHNDITGTMRHLLAVGVPAPLHVSGLCKAFVSG